MGIPFLARPGGAKLFAALAALAGARVDAEPSPTTPTYVDVAPILASHCVECHRPGQIGSMSLASYEAARPWAKSIRKVVGEGSMPPWHAGVPVGVFANERRLAPAEAEAILRWVDAGAPRGDAPTEQASATAEEPPVWRMGTPDQIFTMAEEYVVADDLEDRYETFRVPTGLTEDRMVSGLEIRPGAFDVVHHILIFLVPPGGAAFRQDGGDIFGSVFLSLLDSRSGAGLFAKYAPGGHPEIWPEGQGRRLPAGSEFVFQVHYHKTPGPGTGRRDRSSLGVKYAAAPVTRPITTAWVMNPIFRIEPGASDTKATAYFMFLDNGKIFAMAPHMHVRGTKFRYEALYPNGRRELLLDVPKWDFNWQTSYIYKEPKSIPRGTVIRCEAHWDNSSANPHNPDPGRSVTFGEATTDEMMIGFMDYAYERSPELQAQVGIPGGVGRAISRLVDDFAKDIRSKMRERGRTRSAKR